MTEQAQMPMFPLGCVLLPSMLLPLRVFEPRYREMTRVCIGGDRRFGVVLIERGSEVGGGDVRSSVGCLASIVRAEELADDQWFLLTVGTSRIRVTEWLDDDPFPLALVEDFPDISGSEDDVAELAARLPAIDRQLRTVLAMAAELDEWSVPSTIELSEDPTLALHQMAAVAPLGAFDRQRLLEEPTSTGRSALMGDLLAEADLLLRARLSGA